MKIVIFGHVCVDENVVEGESYRAWGSSVLYMAQYLNEIVGCRPDIIAPHGSDIYSLTEYEMINPPNMQSTLVYENKVRNGKRTQRVRGSVTIPEVTINEECAAKLSAAEMFVYAPLLPTYNASYIQKLINTLPKTALKIILPQGYFRSVERDGFISKRNFTEAEQLLPLFDMMILSNEDTDVNSSIISEWLSFNRKIKVIITRNADGAAVYGADSEILIPTIPLAVDEILNPIGTGDVFGAACAYRYAFTLDIKTSVEFAHRAATQSLLGPHSLPGCSSGKMLK